MIKKIINIIANVILILTIFFMGWFSCTLFSKASKDKALQEYKGHVQFIIAKQEWNWIGINLNKCSMDVISTLDIIKEDL